jgi:hypothetical protein
MQEELSPFPLLKVATLFLGSHHTQKKNSMHGQDKVQLLSHLVIYETFKH